MSTDELSLEHVAVIIPALNEALNLRRLLPVLGELNPSMIIVGDNGSTDATAVVAADHGAVVAHEPKRGYGAACFAGMQLLTGDIEIVVFFDADMADDPALIPAIVAPIVRDECDLVVGTRLAALREPGAMSGPQRFGDWLATRLIRLGWGYDYYDLGPFRAIRRTSLDSLEMRDRGFGWTVEMQIRALQIGLRVQQLPVPYRRRPGTSRISGTIGGIARAGHGILTTIWRLWRTDKGESQIISQRVQP